MSKEYKFSYTMKIEEIFQEIKKSGGWDPEKQFLVVSACDSKCTFSENRHPWCTLSNMQEYDVWERAWALNIEKEIPTHKVLSNGVAEYLETVLAALDSININDNEDGIFFGKVRDDLCSTLNFLKDGTFDVISIKTADLFQALKKQSDFTAHMADSLKYD